MYDPPAEVRAAFEAAAGFMPVDEGLALYAAAVRAAALGPLVEIGSYLGRSTILLAAAAATARTHVVAIDHHRGSEEHQEGWEYHDPALVDPATGLIDTLPGFRQTIVRAGLEEQVIAVVAPSAAIGRYWSHPVGLVFIDGSHTDESAQRDYETWAPHVAPGGILAIHDVYLEEEEGGQAPHRIYRWALAEPRFREIPGCGSLRLLQYVAAQLVGDAHDVVGVDADRQGVAGEQFGGG